LQRLHEKVGLSYTYPPGEVKRVLIEAVMQVDGVLAAPPPDILLLEYGESAIIYDVRYWIDNFAHRQLISDTVLTRIWYAIKRKGMSVPFPIRDVNLRQVPEDFERRVQEQLRQEIFAQLRPLSVFSPLSDEQIDQLSQRAQAHHYTEGEVLVRQGDMGDSLFVIKSGRAQVEVDDNNGRVTTVAKLGQNDFFGEMSLLTGEQRSASVVAETETEVVVVDKSAIAKVLAADMAALEELSQVVEERFQDRAEKVAAAAEKRPGRRRVRDSNLLARIQSFLGLK
jgi:CRP-like cAMP-binding protein